MTDDELKGLLGANAEENRRSFNETAARLSEQNRQYFDVATEAFRREMGLIAEKVTAVDERLTREATEIHEAMRRGFADTQAMIKFSHDELHRRVRALEDTQRTVEQTLADMQTRLERLETSTL